MSWQIVDSPTLNAMVRDTVSVSERLWVVCNVIIVDVLGHLVAPRSKCNVIVVAMLSRPGLSAVPQRPCTGLK